MSVAKCSNCSPLLARILDGGAWTDRTILTEVIPSRFDSWDHPVGTLDRLDPDRLSRAPASTC